MSHSVSYMELYPRGIPLEPMYFDGFVYSMSPKELQQGDLCYYCEDDEYVVPLPFRKYYVCIVQDVFEDAITLRCKDYIFICRDKSRCKRLTFTIPVDGHNIINN